MSLPLILTPQTDTDIAEAFAWYEDQSVGLGDDFIAELDAVFQRIRDYPEMYAVEHRNARRAGLRRFPYVVYYRINTTSIEILGVMHGSRDPRSWLRRS